jgi:hypothetical protein
MVDDMKVKGLTDKEIIKLFSDLKPFNNIVGLVPPLTPEVTEGGIMKTQTQIEKEKRELISKGSLVVCMGPMVTTEGSGTRDLKVGDKAFLSFYTLGQPPVFMFERKGYVLVGMECHYICFSRNNENYGGQVVFPYSDKPKDIRDMV